MADEPLTGTAGQRLFARYAYAPNQLGYCGPSDTAALAEMASTGHTEADVRSIASRFSGAWPYLCVLAELTGIADPLDERVARAYWTGSSLLDEVDRPRFWRMLLDRIGAAGAGRYWTHLKPALLPEAIPTHGFHVFGVYPWTRLLSSANPGPAVHVLDSCRIRWARVASVDADHATVRGRHLAWDGRSLKLEEEVEESVRLTEDGRAFITDVSPGDWLAVHWDLACERLTVAELWQLRRWTDWQLAATNVRLASETAASGSAGSQKLGVYSEAAYMCGAGADQFRFAHSGP
jgi:Family of unknown function (DUF6390)